MQEGKPKVSIGMISYNQKQFIREAVLSAVLQDYDSLEVIVSDDASRDGTREVLRELEQAHAPRLRVLYNEANLGITGNANQVLKACTGQFICLVGGDDVLLPGKIKNQVAFMLVHPEAALSFHDAEVFDSDTGQTLYHYNDGFDVHEGLAADIVKRDFICAGTAMLHRSALPPHGFDARVPHISDWMLWVDVLAGTGKKAMLMPGVFFRYRKHPQSYTSSNLAQVNYRDLASALALARQKYPHLSAAVTAREAELLVLLTVHSLRRRQPLDYSYLRPAWRHLPHLPRGLFLMLHDYRVTLSKRRHHRSVQDGQA